MKNFSLIKFQERLYGKFEECEGRQRQEKMMKHRMGNAVTELQQQGYEREQAWEIVRDARDVYELERDSE
jgi:DNA-binding transcriptional regulator YhcF (GntR family)